MNQKELLEGTLCCLRCGTCRGVTQDMVPDTFILKEKTNWDVAGGSGIIGPNGEYVAGPVYGKEEIIYADIDLREIVKNKAMHDVVGHYARPDVVSLLLREEPYSLIQKMKPKEQKEILEDSDGRSLPFNNRAPNR